MTTIEKTRITVDATVNAAVEKVWNTWTNTDDIVKWSAPSPEWHTPKAEHDLKAGGNFNYRMEARDGSFGFDFGGVFDIVTKNQCLAYTIGDGRKVIITFNTENGGTKIVQTFEAENENSLEQQRAGWQAILDSFKKYVESN